MSHKKNIIQTALYSRICLILLQYIANITIPDHDAKVFLYPNSNETSFGDKMLNHLLGGFVRWDAQYFMHISKYGYTYENTLAFFPLLPLIVRYLSLLLRFFIGFFNFDSLLLFTYITLNILLFPLAALSLYDLTCILFNKQLAYKATLLFCYNPASVFFSAPYTECLFSYLTFKSMLNSIRLYKKWIVLDYLQFKDILLYIIPIALSTITRSNGILNIGFLVYILLWIYFKKLKSNRQDLSFFTTFKFVILLVSCVAFCMIPFIIFQVYCYQMFCKDFVGNFPQAVVKLAELNHFVLPGTFTKHNQSTWCYKTVPLSYSYVQDHYWNVGFFKYYEFKQIPNFILAFPVVYIIMKNCVEYHLKIFPKTLDDLFNFFVKHYSIKLLLVFIVHALFLTIFCVLCIHVQVTTRILCSASPVLYWFSANYLNKTHLTGNLLNDFLNNFYNRSANWVLLYYLGYFVVGTVMFCNFLPWT